MVKFYYQLVQSYGKHDLEVVVYEAKKTAKGNIQIAYRPFILVGNTPDEIRDTLKAIERDIKINPPVAKSDCEIYHDVSVYEDYYPTQDELEEDEIYIPDIVIPKRKYRYDE